MGLEQKQHILAELSPTPESPLGKQGCSGIVHTK